MSNSAQNIIELPAYSVGAKRCWMCTETKSLEDFSNNKTLPGGKQSYCRSCAVKKNKKYKSSPNGSIKMREWNRKKNYGLSAASFKTMFDSQNGQCAVCKTDMGFLARETCVDHDHKTGEIREILCGKCNLGLGHFKDDTEVMKSAIAYLEKHRNSGV